MAACDVLIIGGGPAGSTCAWRLRQAGLDVVVLDKAIFPRPKLCAGWITPAVLDELRLDPAEYARTRVFQPMTAFRVGRIAGPHRVVGYDQPISFGIRRDEFDHYLLCRSGATLQLGEPLKTLRRDGQRLVANERIEAPLVVAAGGHFCPTARLLGHADPPGGPVVACEEFEVELTAAEQATCGVRPEVPEVYFCEDLLGYGWCIRKGSYLNVGLGREDRAGLPGHTAAFFEWLKAEGRIPRGLQAKFHGHAYLLYEHAARPLVDDRVLWIGDAAGLAYSQSGEGIRPAVESGLLAAKTILEVRGDYGREQLESYTARIESRFGPRPRRPVAPRNPSALRRFLAGLLMRNPWFLRRVLLDRWFMHAGQAALRE